MATHAYSWKLVTPTLILEYSVTESNRREKYLHYIVISEQRQTNLPFHMKYFAQGHIRMRTEKKQAPENNIFAHSIAGFLGVSIRHLQRNSDTVIH